MADYQRWGLTHYSYALRGTIGAVGLKTVEVHMATSRRNAFATSVIAPVCMGQISGFGVNSYLLAVEAVASCSIISLAASAKVCHCVVCGRFFFSITPLRIVVVPALGQRGYPSPCRQP